METRIVAGKQPHDRSIQLYIWNNGAVCQSMNFVQLEEGAYAPPAATITVEESQVLMDSLWDCGIRPTEGNGSAGAMRATEKHLEDMRVIAFKFLDVERKGGKL